MNQIPNMKGPLGLKQSFGKDPKHMARVAQLSCCVCEAWGLPQLSAVEVHHVICGRYSQRKAPDRMTIPLCRCHHQGDTGTGRLGIHKDKRAWVALFGEDHEYVAITLDKLEAL